MKPQVNFQPLEVFVVDAFTKTKVVAEYRGEMNKPRGGKRTYKVYTPYFHNLFSLDTPLQSYRWVERFETLGPAPSEESVVTHLSER